MSRAVRIEVRDVGQAFACVGVIRDARSGKRLAETREYPYGQRGNAHDGAELIAANKGWTVASEDA